MTAVLSSPVDVTPGAVNELAEELTALASGLDPDSVPLPEALDWWAALDRVERLAAGTKLLIARRVAESRAWKDAGFASAEEHLARLGGTSISQARAALTASKQLPRLPATESAMRSGDLSTAQAATVAGAATVNPGAEARLLHVAGHGSMSELHSEALRARAAGDPDADSTHRRINRERFARTYTDAEGAWRLVARGTAERGALFQRELDRLTDQVFRAAYKNGQREPREAYAFDALEALARAGSLPYGDSPAPDDATADAATAPGTNGKGAADTPAGNEPAATNPTGSARRTTPSYLALLRIDLEALVRGHVEGDETCEIAGIGPVPARVARNLLGDSILKLVITRGKDVANITHLGRGPTVAQRMALLWTSPTCTVEGCNRTRLEADHRVDWAYTHHTRLDELENVCEHHHDLKTRENWALVEGTGKRPMVPPDDPRHPRNQPGTGPDPP